MELLKCTNVNKNFGDKKILKDINLTIPKGKIIGLLGKNGTGKSTLIKLINDLLTPSSGEILINGKPIGVESKKIISYLPERTYLDKTMTVEEVLNYFEGFYENFDIGKAKKLQAEWNAKKQTELIIHHKTHAGGKWTYYAFAASDDLEKLLKDIADLHWKVNDMNDMYVKARKDAWAYIRMRNAKRANELINKAKLILSESNKQRQNTNKLFEQLLSSSHTPLDTAVLDGRGLWLRDVTSEVLLFVVEVVENGKYVRAWTTRAKGGMEVTLDGRNVVIK